MKTETATVAILKDLVAFDTTSRLSNIPLLDYAIEILRKNGIEPQLIWNDDRTKANLWASIGPEDVGRHNSVRPYRHGAGGRPGMVLESFQLGGTKRQALRAWLLRHERICRGRAGKGSRYGCGRSQTANPHRLLP